MSGFGEYPRGTGEPASQGELTGFETAKVNRAQRNTTQDAANGGGFGNKPTTGNDAQHEDPWGLPATSTTGSWGNGPDSEPPF